MRSIRLLLIVTAVALVALASSGSALASSGIRLSASSIGTGGRLTMNGNVICDVLYTIAMTRNPMLKVTGVDQGSLTGTVRGCTGSAWTGAGTVLAGATVRYESFTGTLPSIIGITITAQNLGMQFATLWGPCLYGGNVTNLKFTVSGGQISALDYNVASTIGRAGGSGLCPSTLTLRGVMVALGTPTVALI